MIATITNPIGLVRNAIAIPNAFVTTVAIEHAALHAFVAIVIAVCATLVAIMIALFLIICAACFTNSTVVFAIPTAKFLTYDVPNRIVCLISAAFAVTASLILPARVANDFANGATASLAYKAFKYNVSALSLIFATVASLTISASALNAFPAPPI